MIENKQKQVCSWYIYYFIIAMQGAIKVFHVILNFGNDLKV